MLAAGHSFRLFARFQTAANYYKVLGVTATSSAAEIKKAYHDLARVHHPDAKTGSEAKFKEIAEAFEVLGDETIRKEYDAVREKNTVKGNSHIGKTYKAEHFQSMKDEEKKKHTSSPQKPYQEPIIQNKTAWSGGHTRTGPSKYYAADANQPMDAVSVALTSMAVGVIVGLVYWAGTAVYAVKRLPQQVESTAEVPVTEFKATRASQRSDLPSLSESIEVARVTRSKFPNEST